MNIAINLFVVILMSYEEYINLLSEKKERINYMHQVIKKIVEDSGATKPQLDVLMRGYIILIYSLWESAYKDLSFYFFYELSEMTIESLPFKLKDKILCFKLEKIKEKKLTTHRCLECVNKEINNIKITKVKDYKNITNFFSEHSNNPDLESLLKLLSLYAFKIEISDESRKQIEFIIKSRNDIAHSGKIIENYNEYIISNFGTSKLEIDILQDITLNIFILYKSVIDNFRKKYSIPKSEKVL